MVPGQVVGFEIDPPWFERLRPVIGEADGLAVRQQGEVPGMEDGLPAFLEGFARADVSGSAPGPSREGEIPARFADSVSV